MYIQCKSWYSMAIVVKDRINNSNGSKSHLDYNTIQMSNHTTNHIKLSVIQYWIVKCLGHDCGTMLK